MATLGFSLPRLSLALVFLIVLSVASGRALPVHGATIDPNTTDDELNADGDCSLREAITAANTDAAVDACPAGAGPDTINLAAGVYAISLAGSGEDAAASGDLDITGDLTIIGLGSDGTTDVDGTALDRVFHVVGAPTVLITDLTIRNGLIGGTGGGGGIRNEGTLTLDDVVVSANTGFNGGGIQSVGDVTIVDSVLTQNIADQDGGAISHTVGTLTLTNSLVSSNDAARFAGGVGNTASLSIEGSTIEFNSAGDDGGGVFNSGQATITETNVTDNLTDGEGAGIANEGTLTLTSTAVAGNSSLGGGGGIHNTGTLGVTNSVIQANSTNDPGPLLSGGGGIQNLDGDVTTSDTTIAGNTSEGTGAGINNFGTLTVTTSAVTGNSTATAAGGGIYNTQTADLTNVTISGNSSGGGGGLNNSLGFVTLTNVTIARNSAPTRGGISNSVTGEVDQGDLAMLNTIVADNGNGDCGGDAVTSAGHNLDSDNSCGLAAAGDLPDGAPNLGPLASNGGPTQTHALLAGSPAIDAGDNTGCAATDQRGVARPQDGDGNGGAVCDIGAYELQVFATATPTPAQPGALPPTGGRGSGAALPLVVAFALLLPVALAAVISVRALRRGR